MKPSTCNEHDRARAGLPGQYGHAPPSTRWCARRPSSKRKSRSCAKSQCSPTARSRRSVAAPRCAPGSSPRCFRHPFRERQTRGKPTLWRKTKIPRPPSTTTWTRRRSTRDPASHQGGRFTGRLRHRERQLGRRRGALDPRVAPGLRECIPVRSVQLAPSLVDWH